MTVKQAIELFGSHQKVQVRQNTRDGYRYLIRNFEALFGDSPVEAISSEDIYQFLLILTEGRTKVSARLRYAQVKAFFNYLVEKRVLRSNPCNDPVLRKTFRAQKRKDRDIVPREIIDEVIYRCRRQRDRLVLELQARCGLRIGEVLHLRACDVKERKLLIKNPKSGREEESAFMPEAISLRLKDYIAGCGHSGEERIFPICYSTARKVIKKLGDAVNVKLRPHDLRRYSATYASRNGVPLEVISKVILRHSDLKTTQMYLGRVTDAEALRWIDTLHSK
jgi:integrase/recombinase XerD